MIKRGKDLKAIYKNEEFFGSIRKDLNLVSIVSYDERSEEKGFEAKRDYYVKRIKIEDEDLEELYEKEFYVRYKDIVEENEIWKILYGTDLEMDIQRGIVVITLRSMRNDNKWKIVEKGVSEKQISLKDCTEYIIKNVYSKKAGKVVDKLEETVSVSEEEFKKAMLEYNRIEYRKQ